MRPLSFIPAFLLLLFGCSKDNSINKIDSDIKINMRETVDSTKRSLQLYCSTEKVYECSNYVISKIFSKSSERIEINFTGIRDLTVCFNSFGPATTTIDLGIISNGTYKLIIEVEGKKSEGKLIVTSDYYKISLDKEKQLQIINSTLNRIPANTIWGTIGYHKSSTAQLVQTFIDSLQLFGSTTQTYQSGDFGYFQINSSGQILPPENHGYYFIRPYIYRYSGNTSVLKTLVKNYGTDYGDSLNIILYTTKGEIFRSWIK